MPKLSLKDFIAKYGGIADRKRTAQTDGLVSGTIQYRPKREIVRTRNVFGTINNVGKYVREKKGVDNIAEIIRELRIEFVRTGRANEYGTDFSNINSGWCLDFARELQRKVGGQIVGPRGSRHYYLFWNGRYYDAEIPDGVKQAENLPFYKREWRASTFGKDFPGTIGEGTLPFSKFKENLAKLISFHSMVAPHIASNSKQISMKNTYRHRSFPWSKSGSVNIIDITAKRPHDKSGPPTKIGEAGIAAYEGVTAENFYLDWGSSDYKFIMPEIEKAFPNPRTKMNVYYIRFVETFNPSEHSGLEIFKKLTQRMKKPAVILMSPAWFQGRRQGNRFQGDDKNNVLLHALYKKMGFTIHYSDYDPDFSALIITND
jgi:hypothetical protein